MELKPKDSEGQALAVGDSVVVRGRVIAIPVPPGENQPGVLQVEWETQAPLMQWVSPAEVTKQVTGERGQGTDGD